VVDGTGLENRHTRKGIGGSNPSLSANPLKHINLGAWLPTVATKIPASSSVSVLGSEGENMTVSLWIRETVGGKRRFVKPNEKKIYPDGVPCKDNFVRQV
jgi:hypothetical protein